MCTIIKLLSYVLYYTHVYLPLVIGRSMTNAFKLPHFDKYNARSTSDEHVDSCKYRNNSNKRKNIFNSNNNNSICARVRILLRNK